MTFKEDFLTADERINLQDLLRRQRLTDGRRLYFEEALAEVFPGAECYYYMQDKIFLLSIPYTKNEKNEERLNYLRHYFFDVTAKLKIYWQYPFGIIGREKTMRIGNTRLYGEERK